MKVIHLLQEYGANINHVAVVQLAGKCKSTKLTDISARTLISVVCDQARVELQNATDVSSVSSSDR